MSNFTIIVGIILAILFFIFAYSLYIKFTRNKVVRKDIPTVAATPSGILCPLCKSNLLKGENLFSRVFRPVKDGVESEQRCIILGCPHCHPYCQDGIKRICPVCHKKVPCDGHLVARLFTHAKGKRHVRITGCSECTHK